MKHRHILTAIFFAIIVFIIYMANTAPRSEFFVFLKSVPYSDKIAHAILYGVMAMLLNYSLNFRTIRFWKFNLQLGAIIVLTFAGLEELTQAFNPNRTLDWGDLIADVVGVVLFSFIRV
ncbi:MAG: VanZ family protein [Campylobacterales bacterium]|nr:VanZ family protein [Campylobacterales bacterium]